MENKEQELLFRYNFFERQISEISQQIDSVNRGIEELEILEKSLLDLINGEGKEIFAPLGKGIFIKSKIISEELIVDIGQGNFVKKSILETKKLVDEQIDKLKNIKIELDITIEKSTDEIKKIISKIENDNIDHKCSCGEECDCDKEEGCKCGEECNCDK